MLLVTLFPGSCNSLKVRSIRNRKIRLLRRREFLTVSHKFEILLNVTQCLTARQSEMFAEFPLKVSFKLPMNIRHLLRNVKRFQNYLWSFRGHIF